MADHQGALDRQFPGEIAEASRACLREWRGWRPFATLLAERPGMTLYLAGGALRNVAMGADGLPPNDFDFFLDERDLDALLREIGTDGRLEHTVFGLPRWYPAGAERQYCDLIPIQRFRTGVGPCADIVDILQRFDFTANAMALEVREGRFFDPLGGSDDLHRRIMRAVRLDYPDEPVMPGHDVRRTEVFWFRLVHYTAKLGLVIEPETLGWLREHVPPRRQRARYEEVFQRLHPRFEEVLERYGLG